jgi:hypothetical protein
VRFLAELGVRNPVVKAQSHERAVGATQEGEILDVG